MTTDPTPITAAELQAMRERCDAATPGPWGYNSYSNVLSEPLAQVWDDDGTPQYPEGKRPGPPFFTNEDNAWLAQRDAAYNADPFVAYGPAHYGDTATGHHRDSLVFIAASRTDVPRLIAEVELLRGMLDTAMEYARHSEGCSAAVGDYPCRCRWDEEGPLIRAYLAAVQGESVPDGIADT